MGLDMYLSKKTFVGFNYKHCREPDGSIPMTTSGKISHIKPERVSEIVEQVGYWRKANAIHNWFVENVQDGEDNCREYYVSREKLEELLERVNLLLDTVELVPGKILTGYTYTPEDGKVETWMNGMVVSNPELCKDILPTTNGFFFGSTEYDQFYVDDLKLTKEILTEALAEEESEFSFSYSSSW